MPRYAHEDEDDAAYPRPRSLRHSPGKLQGALLMLAIALGIAAFFIWRSSGWFHGVQPANDANALPRAVTPRGQRTPEENERITLFKAVKSSVVNVDSLRIARNRLNPVEQQAGTGSGFIWDEQGRVVTNFHVIRETLINRGGEVTFAPDRSIRVTLADESSWNARLVGIAPDNDLAVLQIDAPTGRLQPIKVGSSADLEVGQTVYAIGNPFGQDFTFTNGMVSALNRTIQSSTDRPITGVIQTNAALNPGNSGGPLLDKDGRLIGVNTAITSPSGGSVGIGYAIPADTVNRVVPELIREGREAKPMLGVVTLDDRTAKLLGVTDGIVIREVRPNGPAAKAGLTGVRVPPGKRELELGDVIVRINRQPVNSMSEMARVMSELKVGQEVPVTVRRDGQFREVMVRLEGT